ncbi:hypothetical protein I3760_15G099500 [Carya illinoinensis]|nr:hypothetical protein I3760_15G099500 [Carya illinoinensis]
MTSRWFKSRTSILRGITKLRGHRLLFSFDMRNEMFREIMLPDDTRSLVDHIAIINDSVAVIFPAHGSSNVGFLLEYEIWVLNESIVECSWTKLYTIGVPSRPLQFLDDGLIVLSGSHLIHRKNAWYCLIQEHEN